MEKIKAFHQRGRRYFSQLRREVARSNLTMLRRVSFAFELFLVLYGAAAGAIFHSADLNWYYLLFAGINLPMVFFFFWYGRRSEPSYPVVQGLSILMVVAVLGFAICICLFPYPDRPSIFFPLAYMLVSVLFTMPLWQIALTLTAETGLYMALALRIKTPDALAYDVSGAVTTWLLGFFFLYWVNDLRLRDGEIRLELEHISRTDPLTGLLNRRAMEDNMVRGYRRCQKGGMSVAVVMLDIDDFKQFNDRFGHPAGDRCLMELGRVLNRFAEEQGVFVARYGGEEFIFSLPGSTGAEGVRAGEELLERIRQEELCAPDGVPITLSVGVAAEIPTGEGTFAALVERADAALYRAKARGKNCVAGE